jgi:hypothetical protein
MFHISRKKLVKASWHIRVIDSRLKSTRATHPPASAHSAGGVLTSLPRGSETAVLPAEEGVEISDVTRREHTEASR